MFIKFFSLNQSIFKLGIYLKFKMIKVKSKYFAFKNAKGNKNKFNDGVAEFLCQNVK